MSSSTSQPKRTVGIIGLGLLGSAIAQRLLKAGLDVVGYDTRSEARDRLTDIGGQAASGPGELIRSLQTVVLSLPHSHVVVEILQQSQVDLAKGQCFIDTTTGDPEEMTQIAHRLSDLGVGYIEANVAGSSAQLVAGEVALLIGGDQRWIDRVDDVLGAMSDRRLHVGPSGRAASFKLVHNLILGLHRAVLAEGLCFGEALGFEPAQLLELLQQTPAKSQVMHTKGAKMLHQDYDAQGKLQQHRKDVQLILQLAENAGAKTPLSRLHDELLRQAEQLGFADQDNSAIIEVFRTES